jgi:predicted CoA-binding protein
VNDAEIKAILESAHTIATVGFSTNPQRPGYYVPEYMMHKGYRVIPVNPLIKEVLGQKAYPDLLAVSGKVDMVQIFRPPAEVPAIVDQAIKIGAKVIWMQIGATNRDAALIAQAAGLSVVMDKCMMIEHKRLITA